MEADRPDTQYVCLPLFMCDFRPLKSACVNTAGGQADRASAERTVWSGAGEGNNETNQPVELPPSLQRKVTELLDRAASGPGGGDTNFWNWAGGEVQEAHEEKSFDIERHLDHVRKHLPEDVAEEATADLRGKWHELDPSLTGRPTQADVARSVWASDRAGNGAHNMPDVLPPRLERKVADTMRRVSNEGRWAAFLSCVGGIQ